MTEHPILVPNSGRVTVRWLRGRDGRCLGQEYDEVTPECRKSLLALAKQVAIKGHVGKVPENGHQLEGDFNMLYVLKPGNHRFIGFRHGSDFFITNGAMKQTKGKQTADYRVGLQRRAEFLADLTPSTKHSK